MAGPRQQPKLTVPSPRTASRWQPSSGIFAPTTGLDPRLFGSDGRLHGAVTEALMTRLDVCIRTDGQLAGSDWQEWLHVWLAGGSASEWAGNRPNEQAQDLDVLVGITDLDTAQGYDAFEGMDREQAAAALNAVFRHCFNEDGAALDGVEGTWDLTAYCNPAVTDDVMVIRPYAAYDVTDGCWAVRPPHLPGHSLADLNPAVVAQARAVAAEARAILRMEEPLRTREARALWERVHAERGLAFGPEGTGWDDPGNVAEKWLAYAPHGLLSKIRDLALAPRTASAEEEPQTYYHVSYERFPRGHLLTPQGRGWANFDSSSGEHVHMTDSDYNAERYRYHLWEQGYPEQHKYVVRPTGPVEPDPDDPEAVRTRHPVEVVDAADVDRDGNEEWDSDWFNGRHTAASARDDQLAGMDPATRAAALAQEQVRLHHPRTTMPLDAGNGQSSHVISTWLAEHGHPGAQDAYVARHPDPGAMTSNTGRGPDGEPVIALHPDRWDYGSAAHEAAHLITDHQTGRGFGEPHGAEGAHGPQWAKNYAGLLDRLSQGAGGHFMSLYRQQQGPREAVPRPEQRAEPRPHNLPANGGMVYLSIPHGTVQGGAQGQEHHVSLAYLPRDMSDEDFGRAVETARAAAARHAPFKGVIGGTGTFPPGAGSDVKRSVHVPVESPAIHALHREFAGIDLSNHPEYTPHVTLGYYGRGLANPEPHPSSWVPFTHVHVRRGSEVHSFPLRGGMMSPAERATRDSERIRHPERYKRQQRQDQELRMERERQSAEDAYRAHEESTLKPWAREGAARGVRMVPPEEYGQYLFPDYPAKTLPALARHLRKTNPGYYARLRGDVEANGVQAPILLRHPGVPGHPVSRPQVMDGHHRGAVAYELGLAVPVGDYDNEEHYEMAARHGRQWFRDNGELKAAGAPGWQSREAATGYDLKPRSGMIYLDLPPGTVRPVPGGVDDHHVTLVYLGADVSDEAFEEACRRAQAAAAKCPPLEGVLRGIDIFPPSNSSDGKVPAFVPVFIGGVGRLRRELEDLSASEHKDWKPHCTLAYLGDGDSLPAPHPAVPLRFTHLHVKRGNEIRSFPLAGRVRAQAVKSRIWYHGTSDQLQPGQEVLPGSVSGRSHHDDVYVTNHLYWASTYASKRALERGAGGRGHIYEVMPHEEPEKEQERWSYTTPGATVIREVHPDWYLP